MTNTESILRDAKLIIDNHHDGFNEDLAEEVYCLQHKAMQEAGFRGKQHSEDEWDEWIDKLPGSIKATMIQLDDCADCHNNVRYM